MNNIRYYIGEAIYKLKDRLYYYEIRAIFKPYNRIKVRNCPRTWTDRDNILFHGMFSVLCDFIERENKNWEEKIKDTESGWHETNNILNNLYVWYNSVDWDKPVPISEEFSQAMRGGTSTIQHDGYSIWEIDDEYAVNGKTYRQLSDEYNNQKIQFEELKKRNMKLLVDYYDYLWT